MGANAARLNVAMIVVNTIICLMYLLANFQSPLAFFVETISLEILLIYILKRYYRLSGFYLWLSLMILSIPTSFKNLFGGDYGTNPVSWYNLFFAFLIISFFIKKYHFSKYRAFNVILLVCWLLINTLNSFNQVNAFKDLLNFIPLLFMYSIYPPIDDNKEQDLYLNFYNISAISAAICLFVQVTLFLLGLIVGNLTIYPGRIAFGSIFSDYSFLSLFFATTAAMNYPKRKISLFLLFSIATVLTSARTGFFALLVALLLFDFFKYLRRLAVMKLIFHLLFIFTLLLIGISIIKFVRPYENIFDPTGRLQSINFSLKLIADNWLWGIGLGVEEFKKYFGFSIPHNILIQVLLQSGIVGLFLFSIIVVSLWKDSLSTHYSYAFATIFTGSMFIPDIMNSRFLPVIVFLIIHQKYLVKERHKTDELTRGDLLKIRYISRW